MLPRPEKLMDIIWSPFKEDEFAAYGSDLCLYRVKNSNLQSSKSNYKMCIYLKL